MRLPAKIFVMLSFEKNEMKEMAKLHRGIEDTAEGCFIDKWAMSWVAYCVSRKNGAQRRLPSEWLRL